MPTASILTIINTNHITLRAYQIKTGVDNNKIDRQNGANTTMQMQKSSSQIILKQK